LSEPRVTICAGCQGYTLTEEDRPELERALEAYIEARGLADDVWVVPALCLNVCGPGVTLVVHPNDTWYSVEGADDLRAVVDQHLIGGEPVAHLCIEPPD
jgi:(2Fe-2S) ferredoxin